MWFRWRRIRAAPSSLGFGAHVSFLEAGFKLAQDHWQRGGGQWWAGAVPYQFLQHCWWVVGAQQAAALCFVVVSAGSLSNS